jgi:hypothetical protein
MPQLKDFIPCQTQTAPGSMMLNGVVAFLCAAGAAWIMITGKQIEVRSEMLS